MKRIKINSKKTEQVIRWLWENDIRHHQTAEYERGWEIEVSNKNAKLLSELLKD